MRTWLFLFAFLLSIVASAQQKEVAVIKNLVGTERERLIAIFKDLHQNPEYAFQETRTASIVAKELKALGYEVFEGVGKTGVLARMKNGAGKSILYRADMDANPVQEATGLPYASTRTTKIESGKEVPLMHACGHDAHVTWLLGVAKNMAQMKSAWKGTLLLIAQPAEEIVKGANAVAADPVFKEIAGKPDYLFGMHTWPYPVGTVDNSFKERMAGSDLLDVEFYGVGGHGSSPELTKDPVVMAANAVLQYQTIVSRNIAAQEIAVITVGSIQAGLINNVIPQSALLRLNTRWFNNKTRDIILNGIEKVNEGIFIANGLPADKRPKTTMLGSVYPLVNDDEPVAKVNKSLEGLIKPEKILSNQPAIMASEDFYHLIKGNGVTKADYMFVGVANPGLYAKAIEEGKKFPFTNHNPNFVVDLDAIPLGVEIGTTAVLALFK